MFNISVFSESPSCDHLYFTKQVFFWGDYKVGNIAGRCQYSSPAQLLSSAWDQKAEKLARRSLMFSDLLSLESPDQGVKVHRQGGTLENLWATSQHRLVLPWTLRSGFDTGENNEWLKVKFGQNPWRTAVIWGLQLMRSQVAAAGTVEPKIYVKYSPDITSGVYSNWRKPHGTEDGYLKFSIQETDLDDNGLYYFKQPAPNQDKNMIFVASEVQVKFDAGIINFDFLGTFYDYNVAKSGLKNGKADNWNEENIGNFWMKGLFFMTEIMMC